MTIDRIQAAVQAGDVAAVHALASAAPEVLKAVCGSGWTALIVAAYSGQSACLAALLTQGADPNQTNNKGTTPLMYAKGHYLRTGDPVPMQLLLEAGADRFARDNTGRGLIDYVEPDRRAEIEMIFDTRPLR